MGQHRDPNRPPKAERDGKWWRQDRLHIAEAIHTYGQPAKVTEAQRSFLNPLPEPEEL